MGIQPGRKAVAPVQSILAAAVVILAITAAVLSAAIYTYSSKPAETSTVTTVTPITFTSTSPTTITFVSSTTITTTSPIILTETVTVSPTQTSQAHVIATLSIIPSTISYGKPVANCVATQPDVPLNGFIAFEGTGILANTILSVVLTYGGNTYVIVPAGFCKVFPSSFVYVQFSEIPAVATKGEQFGGYASMADGEQVTFAGAFT